MTATQKIDAMRALVLTDLNLMMDEFGALYVDLTEDIPSFTDRAKLKTLDNSSLLSLLVANVSSTPSPKTDNTPGEQRRARYTPYPYAQAASQGQRLDIRV